MKIFLGKTITLCLCKDEWDSNHILVVVSSVETDAIFYSNLTPTFVIVMEYQHDGGSLKENDKYDSSHECRSSMDGGQNCHIVMVIVMES